MAIHLYILGLQKVLYTYSSEFAALDGHSFGDPGDLTLFRAVCSGSEANLNECHVELGYRNLEASAGVICEGKTRTQL